MNRDLVQTWSHKLRLLARNRWLRMYGFKMATGSGKTTVMAMLIAWHTLNKLANPQDFAASPPPFKWMTKS